MNYKTIFVSLVLSLTACASNTDLQVRNLSNEDIGAIHKIKELGQARCMRTTFDKDTDKKTSGDMKFHSELLVKKLFKGQVGWYKSEVLVDGVWDNIYYNNQSGSIVCGKRQWEKANGDSSVQFIDISKGATAPTPLAKDRRTAPDGDVAKKIVVNWNRVSENFFTGQIYIHSNKGSGTVRVELPTGAGTCAGAYEYRNQAHGVWSLVCTNGHTAKGQLNGNTGVGTDNMGGNLQFIILD